MFYFYTKIAFANFLNGRILHLKSIKFLGFKIYFKTISELEMLIEEIFIDEAYYFKFKKNNPTIYDCGGNIGVSVLYFKHLYPGAKIKVFEPSPDVVALLEKNIEANNLKGVSVCSTALSDSEGTVSLFIREGMSLASTTSLEERRGGTEVTVRKSKLSEYIDEDVDLLKIDVQLSEGSVFKDLSAAASSKNIKSILMEYHYAFGVEDNNLSDILNFFEKNSFSYKISLNAEKPDGFKTYIIEASKKPV